MAASTFKKTFRGKRVLVLLLTPILALLILGSALADTKIWTGNVDNSWRIGGNWDSLGVPLKGDSVYIKTTGDEVTYDNPVNPTLRYFEIDDPIGIYPYPTLFQEQGTLTSQETVIGLTNGLSLYDQRGGTHRTLVGDRLCDGHPCGDLSLGGSIYRRALVGESPWGDYTLLHGTLAVGGNEWVGVYGEGRFTQGSATPALGCTPPVNPPPVIPPPPGPPVHTVGKNLYLGVAPLRQDSDTDHLGEFNLYSGSLTVNGSIRVGIQGGGLFDQTNGVVKIKGNDPDPLNIDVLSSDSGDFFNLRKVKTKTQSLECVASRSPGLIVGLYSNGRYNLTDGTLNVNYSEIIGLDAGGNGIFNQTNGTHTISGNLFIAKNTELESYNYFSLEGPLQSENQSDATNSEVGLVDVGGFASVGYLGYGDFLQTGGTVKIRGIDQDIVNLNLRGRVTSSRNSSAPTLQCTPNERQYIGLTVGRGGLGGYYLTDGELLVSRGEVIGLYPKSDGYFQHNSGSHYVGGSLTIARDSESKGMYDFYDGMLVVRGGLVNNGSFNQLGGSLQAQVTNNKEYNFSGGTIQGKITNNSQFNVEEQGGQKVLGDFFNQANATVTANHTNAQFNRNFYNSGKLEILGGASLNIKNLTVNPTGYLSKTGDPTTLSIKGNTISNPVDPDTLTVTGNLINNRTNPGDWRTELVDLVFSGAGTHYFKTGSNNTGIWDNNFAWKSMTIIGDENTKLRLQGHLYAKKIEGVLSNAGTITNLTGFCGIGIYYDKDLSQDLAGLKLYNPWGRLVGNFTADGFVSTCE